MSASFRVAAATVLSLCVWADTARADIYVTRAPDGTLQFSNGPGPRPRGATVVIRSRDPSPHGPSQVITAHADDASSGGSGAIPQSAYVRSLYDATAHDPSRYTRYDAYIREAATLYQLPEALIRAVIKEESDFNPYSVSSSGAAGLMQLMPDTAESMMVRDVFDPRQSVLGGTRLLRILANMFNGDLVLTIAAYNAGPNAVIRYAGVPPYEETQNYVRAVLRFYYEFRAGQGPGAVSAGLAPASTLVAP